MLEELGNQCRNRPALSGVILRLPYRPGGMLEHKTRSWSFPPRSERESRCSFLDARLRGHDTRDGEFLSSRPSGGGVGYNAESLRRENETFACLRQAQGDKGYMIVFWNSRSVAYKVGQWKHL